MARRYKGRGQETPEPWEAKFLEEYVTQGGGISLCAKAAGTTWQRVRKWEEESERFAALFETARMEAVETLERRLVNLSNGAKGNFLAIIARLKAERPDKWVEKNQIASVLHVHTAAPPGENIRALLRDMLAESLPETRAQITGEVIDVRPHEQEVGA